MDEKKKKKGLIIRIIIAVLGCILLFGGIYLIFKHFGITSISKEKIQEYIQQFGAWGPIIFIGISFLQVTFIPIPSTVTILAGSYLFGAWPSFFYSYIGIILGSLFAFFLGRLLGRPFVNWVVGDKNTVETYLKRFRGKEFTLMFFMFLLPFFPDDTLCAIAGILPISWLGFIIMQLLTRITSILGNILFLSGEFIPYDKPWGIATIVILCILGVVAFIICYKNTDRIQKWLDDFVTKHFPSKKKIEENDVKTEDQDSNLNQDK